MIGILDYGMGNLRSVSNSLNFLRAENIILRLPEDLKKVSHLIIPGVGAFPKAMQSLNDNEFVPAIKEFAIQGKPLLGICLGMQLLADSSEEIEYTRGLGLIPGKVELFNASNLRVPHMGWNGIEVRNNHPILEGVKLSADFYYVHSFFYRCVSPRNILAQTQYGGLFDAIVASDLGNVIGVQFHPEKSQKQGIRILENFAKMR